MGASKSRLDKAGGNVQAATQALIDEFNAGGQGWSAAQKAAFANPATRQAFIDRQIRQSTKGKYSGALGAIGKVVTKAAPFAALIPGVGPLLAGGISAAAKLAGGGNLIQALQAGVTSGAGAKVLGGKGITGIGDAVKKGGGLLKTGASLLKGKGLPGSSGSLLQQLATAVPGVIGAIEKGKQTGRQNRLLQSQSDIFGNIARTGQGLVDEAAPLRQGANAAIMARLNAGRPPMDFATDRLNPFTPGFNPGAAPAPAPAPAPGPELPPGVLPFRRRRPLLGAGGGGTATPYLNAAVQ